MEPPARRPSRLPYLLSVAALVVALASLAASYLSFQQGGGAEDKKQRYEAITRLMDAKAKSEATSYLLDRAMRRARLCEEEWLMLALEEAAFALDSQRTGIERALESGRAANGETSREELMELVADSYEVTQYAEEIQEEVRMVYERLSPSCSLQE